MYCQITSQQISNESLCILIDKSRILFIKGLGENHVEGLLERQNVF